MEFKIENRYFSIKKLNPFEQAHVLRRMGSLFPTIVGAKGLEDKLLGAAYIAAALAKLTDQEADFIMNKCLSACQLKQGAVWADITDSIGTLMFQDLELPTLLELVWKVLELNFRPFIADLLAKVSSAEVVT